MAFKDFYGRLILVMIMVVDGLYLITHPHGPAELFKQGYLDTHTSLQSVSGYSFPVSPQVINENAVYIMVVAGFFEVTGALLTVLGYKLGALIVACQYITANVLVHNPLYYQSPQEKVEEAMQAILNFGVVSALLISVGQPRCPKLSS